MKKLSAGEAKILVIIYKSSLGLEKFNLFKKSRLSLSEFFNSLQSLIASDLIEVADEKIKITDLGAKIIDDYKGGYMISGIKKWREVPERFNGEKIYENSLYVPSRMRIGAGLK